MKKISLIALALCTSAAVFAQDTQPQLRTPMEQKVRFGIRAGANLAKFRLTDFNGVNEPSVQTKTSMHAGLFMNAPLGGMFAIQPGVEYSGQGGKYKDGTDQGEFDMHYINVPIMFQWKSAGGFLVETGPQAGILLRANFNDEEVEDETFKTLDISWGAGLGYVSRIGLGVNARFNYGLTNILEGDNDTDNTPQLKNQVIQLGLVYHFGAHK
ncbi:MAG: PorT family protein [Chitinophagaceae bacterium]|nr:MAG: PorT family protein [Chitinophagaceae bacterium]